VCIVLRRQIDGGQHIGMAAVGRGVNVAIGKAKEHGMSIVAVNNYSSATGALGVWANKITDAGLIGIVLSQVCTQYSNK
jgi:LDH2 family malate/lactate/ureidoglycolate dehydrogenase